MPVLVEQIHAVRAHMVDGAVVDLLLFADPERASEYAQSLKPLPLGFDFVEVISRRVIGAIVERRHSARDWRRFLRRERRRSARPESRA